MNTTDIQTRISDLVAVANKAHEQSLLHEARSVREAIAAGEALIEIRALLPEGGWDKWLTENYFLGGTTSAKRYVRLATYKGHLHSGLKTKSEAERFLTRHVLPAIREERQEANELRQQAAREMKKSGKTYTEIAQAFGVSRNTATWWCRPVAERRMIQRRNSRIYQKRMRDLRTSERQALLRKARGDVSVVYANLRKAAEALDVAIKNESNELARGHLRNALSRLYETEDQIAAALRTTQLESKAA